MTEIDQEELERLLTAIYATVESSAAKINAIEQHMKILDGNLRLVANQFKVQRDNLNQLSNRVELNEIMIDKCDGCMNSSKSLTMISSKGRNGQSNK